LPPLAVGPRRTKAEDLAAACDIEYGPGGVGGLLREQPQDGARHFLGASRLDLPPETIAVLGEYDWPGNVRELANVVERAVVLSIHGTITSDLLLLGSREVQSPRCEPLKLKEAREQFEKAYLVQVLTTVKGNVSRAAELAGKDRAEFYKLLRKYALDPGAFKGEKTAG